MNNCKNCGTPIVPGELRCPTCNLPYAETDALKVDIKMPNMNDTLLVNNDKGLPLEVSAQEGLERLRNPKKMEEEEYDPDAIIPIEPPSTFEVDESVAPSFQEIQEEQPIKEEEKSYIVSKQQQIDKGTNKAFVGVALFLLLIGGGLFLYGNFIDPNIYNKLLGFANKDNLTEVVITEEIYSPYLKTDANIDEVRFILEFGLSTTHNLTYSDVDGMKITAVINKSSKNGESSVFEGQTKIDTLISKLDKKKKYTIALEKSDEKFLYLVITETNTNQVLNLDELMQIKTDEITVDKIIPLLEPFKVFYLSETVEQLEDGNEIIININGEYVPNNKKIQEEVDAEIKKLSIASKFTIDILEFDEIYKIVIKEIKSTE